MSRVCVRNLCISPFPIFDPFSSLFHCTDPCGHKALGTRMQILSFEFQLVSVQMCTLQICTSAWVNLDQWLPTVNSQVARLLCSHSSHHRGKLWGTRPGTVRGCSNWRITTSKDSPKPERTKNVQKNAMKMLTTHWCMKWQHNMT